MKKIWALFSCLKMVNFSYSADIVQWLLADRRPRNINMSFVLLVRRAWKFWRKEFPLSSGYKIRQLPVTVALICQAIWLYILGARRWTWLEPLTQRCSVATQTAGYPRLHRGDDFKAHCSLESNKIIYYTWLSYECGVPPPKPPPINSKLHCC